MKTYLSSKPRYTILTEAGPIKFFGGVYISRSKAEEKALESSRAFGRDYVLASNGKAPASSDSSEIEKDVVQISADGRPTRGMRSSKQVE